jgi:hypothetical protein
MQFIQIPPTAIFAHYVQITPGIFAVITSQGKNLAPSFYDLRHQYTAAATMAGTGCWVILLPIPQLTQASLF